MNSFLSRMCICSRMLRVWLCDLVYIGIVSKLRWMLDGCVSVRCRGCFVTALRVFRLNIALFVCGFFFHSLSVDCMELVARILRTLCVVGRCFDADTLVLLEFRQTDAVV